MLYHITNRQDWADAEIQNSYKPASLTSDGFIHLSTDKQLMATAARHYKGKTDLLVVVVNEKNLDADLTYEDVDGVSFPHLFGPLNMDAVSEVVSLPVGESGEFEIPPEWSEWKRNFSPS